MNSSETPRESPTRSVDEAVEALARMLSTHERSWQWDHVSHEGDRQFWRAEAREAMDELRPLIAAAFRAEAVADEQRRLADELEDLANKARAAANTVVFASSQSRLRIEAGAYDAAARLVRTAADSVPVATPEPTVEIGGQVMTVAQYNAAQYPLLIHPSAEPCEWFRSTPESEAMLTDERAHVAATEAAAPARCQGFTIRERPDHQPLGPCIHCGNIYQQH